MSRIENSNNPALRLIEQYGVNHVGVRGRNFAMMYLAENCSKRALETFLQHKIDVKHQDDEGNTLTDYILRYQPNAQRAFRHVMRRGKFSLCEKKSARACTYPKNSEMGANRKQTIFFKTL
ncbi:MAG: hypothetical protein ChlgKO_08080 [Chlamydiales bacterium]